MKKIQLTSHKFFSDSDYYLSEDALIFPEDNIKRDKILVSDFWTDSKIQNFKIDLSERYQRILPMLSAYMNLIHNESESIEYWERLTGFWLQSVISNFLEKYWRLQIAFEKIENLVANSISFDSFQTPLSTKEYFYAIRGSEFIHLQQYSLLLEQFFPHQVKYTTVDWNISSDADKVMRGNKNSTKQKIKDLLLSLTDRGYKSDIAMYVTLFSNKDLQKLFIKSNFKIAPILKDITFENTRSLVKNTRKKIIQFTTGNVFNDFVLHAGIKYLFPIELMEGYKAIKENAVQLLIKKQPKTICTGIGWIWNTHFSIWAAKCASKGTKLVGIQHGGTYGEVESLREEYIERKVVDNYITWGWKEDGKTIPLSAPRLVSRKSIETVSEDEILWVTTADCRFNHFVGDIVFGSRFLKYFEHQQALYNALSPEIQSKIRVRLYPDDFGWKLKERWLAACPNVQFANPKESFLEQANRAKLIIIDHFGGTTTLEILIINKPIIVVGSLELFKVRSSASPFYDSMNKVDVFQYDIESAATIINSQYVSIENWWKDISRQKSILYFIQNFASNSKSPLDQWVEFLLN